MGRGRMRPLMSVRSRISHSRKSWLGAALALSLVSLAGGDGGRLRESASLRFVSWQPGVHRGMPRSGGARIYRTFREAPIKADFRPEWQRRSGAVGSRVDPNTSILSRKDDVAPPDSNTDSIWDLSVLEKSASVSASSSQGRLQSQVRERLGSMQQQMELLDRHSLLGQNQQLEWANQNRALGRTFLRSLLSMQVRDSLRKAENRSAEVRAVSRVQQKLDWLATTGVAVEVEEGWRFGSKADFPRQSGRLWMNSPLLNGSLDFRVGAQDTGLGDVNSGSEAVRLAVDRELFWDLESGVTFGGSSRTVTTHVRKALAPNLTCSVENRQNVQVDSRSEQTARLNYQLVF